jgi:hypothetical protein
MKKGAIQLFFEFVLALFSFVGYVMFVFPFTWVRYNIDKEYRIRRNKEFGGL